MHACRALFNHTRRAARHPDRARALRRFHPAFELYLRVRSRVTLVWLGRQDYSASCDASPCGLVPLRVTILARFARCVEPCRFSSSRPGCPSCPLTRTLVWLGRQDSNLRYTGSKPDALPLGYAPSNFIVFVRSNPAAARKDSNLRESRKLSSPARRPRIFLTASAGVNSRRIRRRR